MAHQPLAPVFHVMKQPGVFLFLLEYNATPFSPLLVYTRHLERIRQLPAVLSKEGNSHIDGDAYCTFLVKKVLSVSLRVFGLIRSTAGSFTVHVPFRLLSRKRYDRICCFRTATS